MANIRVGKPHAKPDSPTHVTGIREGNEGPYHRQRGHHRDGTADARRSTGVHPRRHDAITKTMPNLPPG
jgi:hypothetical protein